jgi:hypothetical protein
MTGKEAQARLGELAAQIGARLVQRACDMDVAVAVRDRFGGQTVMGALARDICAGGDQVFDLVEGARLRRAHERRIAALAGRVDVGAHQQKFVEKAVVDGSALAAGLLEGGGCDGLQ